MSAYAALQGDIGSFLFNRTVHQHLRYMEIEEGWDEATSYNYKRMSESWIGFVFVMFWVGGFGIAYLIASSMNAHADRVTKSQREAYNRIRCGW